MKKQTPLEVIHNYNPDNLVPNLISVEETPKGILVIKQYDTRDPEAQTRFYTLHKAIYGTDFDMVVAREWLVANGWTARSWPYGFRAWKGSKAWPIRTAGQIRAYRRRLKDQVSWYGETLQKTINSEAFNLAFDL
jgi:hypothetical protein